MIRADRELLAELALLNGDTSALALRIMDGSASATEQQPYTQRLIAVGRRLQRRAEQSGAVVIDGEVAPQQQAALAPRGAGLDRAP